MRIASLEGKTKSEKKKIIAAGVLGLVALVALYLAFGRSSGGTASATVKVNVTPKPTAAPSANKTNAELPTRSEQDFVYQTTAVVYPGTVSAPEPGRNIFAFYEPPKPCGPADPRPSCVSPIPSPSPIKTAPPPPPPPILLTAANPQSIYAGENAFRLEIRGDKFTPDSHIYFNQAEIPTRFITAQHLIGEVASKLISTEGPRQIIVQTPDGKLYSNQAMLTVIAPPKPTMLYIGMMGRKRYNNDTAYFQDTEKGPPYSARLNDVVGGRFRLIDISPSKVIFQDISLPFKHPVPITKGILTGSMPPGRGTESEPGVPTYPPGFVPPQAIPGIPNNIQQFDPGQQRKLEQQKQKEKEDVDDEGDG